MLGRLLRKATQHHTRISGRNTQKKNLRRQEGGRHGGFANLACDAALLACWVTTKRVLTAEAWAQRVLLVRVVKCELQTVAPSGLAHRRPTGLTLGSSSVSNVLVKPRHISVMNITRLVRSKTATQNPSVTVGTKDVTCVILHSIDWFNIHLARAHAHVPELCTRSRRSSACNLSDGCHCEY